MHLNSVLIMAILPAIRVTSTTWGKRKSAKRKSYFKPDKKGFNSLENRSLCTW